MKDQRKKTPQYCQGGRVVPMGPRLPPPGIPPTSDEMDIQPGPHIFYTPPASGGTSGSRFQDDLFAFVPDEPDPMEDDELI